MADLAAHIQSPAATFGRNHHQDYKLMYDTANIVRHCEQRSSPDTVQGSPQRTANGHDGQSTTELATNETDEEDSSGGQTDEKEDDEDKAEVPAPSHGYGKGKGRRPAIRIESADEDSSREHDDTSYHEAGPTNDRLVMGLTNGNKKRTYSNVSNTSLLFGEDDAGQHTFPRPKVARTLSHSGGTGLLTYTVTDDVKVPENAIESDDENAAELTAGEQTTDVDDEDYSGLNQISDDEDDIEKIEQLEERFIISDELKQVFDADGMWPDIDSARRLSLDSYASEGIFPLPDPSDAIPWAGELGSSLFDQEDRASSPKPIPKRKLSEGSSKRVRFDDEVHMSDSSSSSSSDDFDSALYPDLFLDQDKLPASVHQLIELDNQSDDGYPSNASDQSFWDYVDMDSRNVTPDVSDASDESDPEAGSSGYETDEGDTTDEWESDIEMPSAPQTPRPKSVLNRPSSAPASRAATPKPFQRSSAGPSAKPSVGPPRGVFYHDDAQPIVITDRKTKALTYYRPKAVVPSLPAFNAFYPTHNSSSGSTANDSPRASIQQLNASDNDATDEVISNPADIMMSGMVETNLSPWPYFGAIGPTEAFFPTVYVNSYGEIIIDQEFELDSFGDDDDEFDDDFNLSQFMDFGSDNEDATDVDQGNQTDAPDVPATPSNSTAALAASTPAQPDSAAATPLVYKHSNANDIYEHLHRSGVTAFRNNQNRFRDLACLPHDPSLRASVSRPIRSGRSAETLISPLRKRSSIRKKQPRDKASARQGRQNAYRRGA